MSGAAGANRRVGWIPAFGTRVSTVRHLIPQRTFKYVATVESVTDETCQKRILNSDARVSRRSTPGSNEACATIENGTYPGTRPWSTESVRVVFLVLAEEEIGDLLRVEVGRAGTGTRTLTG
jgi:hypothetical protein